MARQPTTQAEQADDPCALLRRTNELLKSILEAEGVHEDGPEEPAGAAFAYAALPPERDEPTLALPPGEIQVDHERGRVVHSATSGSGFPDAGDLNIDLPTIDDMVSAAVVSSRLKTLRSLQIWSDIDGSVRLGTQSQSGGFIHLFGGLYQTIKSHGFGRYNIHASHPFELRANVSTRADAFVTSDQRGAMTRRGERAAGTHDDFVPMFWWPGGLDDVLADADASVDHTDYQEERIPTLGHDNITVMVENDSGNGNAIDVQLQARDEPDESFYQVGTIADAVPDGDHTIFDVQEEHRTLRARIRNDVDGTTVSASGQLTAGGT